MEVICTLIELAIDDATTRSIKESGVHTTVMPQRKLEVIGKRTPTIASIRI